MAHCSEFVKCPFDEHHRVLKTNIQKHLMRCEKNHPTIKLVQCEFNKTHKIKPEKIQVRFCAYLKNNEDFR